MEKQLLQHYPDGSGGGSNVLKLVKFRSWTTWSGAAVAQVNSASVGSGWHSLRLEFKGVIVRVYYDGELKLVVPDIGYDSRPAYTSGGVSVGMWTAGTAASMYADNVIVTPVNK